MRFEESKPDAINSTTVVVGIRILMAVTIVFERANSSTPNQLRATKTAMSTTAMTMPRPVSEDPSYTRSR